MDKEAHDPHHTEAKTTLKIPDFPADLHKQLETTAESLGVTVTDLLITIVEEWMTTKTL